MGIFGFSARFTGGGRLLGVGCARMLPMLPVGDFESCRTFLAGSKNLPVCLVDEASVECGGGTGSACGDLGVAKGNPGLEVGTCDGNGPLGRAKDLGGDRGESIVTVGGDRGEDIELIEVGRRRREELLLGGCKLWLLVVLVAVCESDTTAFPRSKSGESLRGMSSEVRSSA